MQVNNINSAIPDLGQTIKINQPDDGKFKNVLTDFIGSVNQDQLNVDKLTKQYVQGGDVQIQDVMIAGEQAKTSLQLLMEIRNKALDMYQELTRITV